MGYHRYCSFSPSPRFSQGIRYLPILYFFSPLPLRISHLKSQPHILIMKLHNILLKAQRAPRARLNTVGQQAKVTKVKTRLVPVSPNMRHIVYQIHRFGDFKLPESRILWVKRKEKFEQRRDEKMDWEYSPRGFVHYYSPDSFWAPFPAPPQMERCAEGISSHLSSLQTVHSLHTLCADYLSAFARYQAGLLGAAKPPAVPGYSWRANVPGGQAPLQSVPAPAPAVSNVSTKANKFGGLSAQVNVVGSSASTSKNAAPKPAPTTKPPPGKNGVIGFSLS